MKHKDLAHSPAETKSMDEDMHPWTFIAEELLARGWSVEDLAMRMSIPDYEALTKEMAKNMLVLDLYRTVGPKDGRCRIGERAGRAIARAFGVSDDLILNLERAWREPAKDTDHG